MARDRAALWTYLLGSALVLAVPPPVATTTPDTFPRPPELIGCLFQNRANVTCRWEAADPPASHYTLQVCKVLNKTKEHEMDKTYSLLQMFTCTTSQTSCTAGMNSSSVRFIYCVVVTAHTRRGNVSSASRCQSGRTEVMLPPVILGSIQPVTGKPRCLTVSWRGRRALFPVSKLEVQNGFLKSQLQFTAQSQPNIQVKNVNVTNLNVQVCYFKPDTSYTVRLRHRFQSPRSQCGPWSLWSNAQQGRTAEDAPSAAPAFWRRIQRRDENGWRRVSLLWKPLLHSLANGRVLFYNVTCQTESARSLDHYGSCRALPDTSTSCSLLLPVGRCSCALTASNSAGASPEARVWLRGSSGPEPASMAQITAKPLDASSIDVRWAAPGIESASGFVLEWFAVREDASTVLYWERLNHSCRALVITEGIKPMERYSVSVTVLYGEQGVVNNRMLHVYTMQGAPSAGPMLKVQQLSGSTVELSWRPVPVELRRGFIRNHTLCYSAVNQTAKCVLVPGHAHTYSLKGLLSGNYVISMRSNTDAGAGAAGPIINVRIDLEEFPDMTYVILPPVVMLLALVLMGCLLQNYTVKQKLCQDIPDPSYSSLAHWTPKVAVTHSLVAERSDIKCSEVHLPTESELQTCYSDREIFNLQAYASLSCSPAPSPRRSPSRHKLLELLNSKTTSRADLCSCDFMYSEVLTSQTLKKASVPCLSGFYCHTGSSDDARVQLGAGEELPHSHSSVCPTDEQKSCNLKQHPLPGCDDPSFQSTFNSLLCSFARPDAPPANVSTAVSPFPPQVFVDMSYTAL